MDRIRISRQIGVTPLTQKKRSKDGEKVKQPRETFKLKAALTGLLVIVFFVSFPITGFGFGLEVDPTEIVARGVPLGEKAALSDLGLKKLSIKNKSDTAYTYTIDILFSAEAQAPLEPGYQDIPDTTWLIPENKEVRIPAKSSREIELYLEIPELEEYYDKRYQAIIEIKSKKNRPQDIFVLAAQLEVRFSTRGQRTEDRGQKND